MRLRLHTKMKSRLPPHPSSLLQGATQAGRYLAQSLRLMVGIPRYDTYLAHMAANHPEQTPMDYEAFFRERQEARYAGGAGKCC
jgi:uncharacterized short protein YbdD (DUF466 family)